ncbi:MAG: GNAT family N-acetyltransferase [Pseudomonadota bacterium]
MSRTEPEIKVVRTQWADNEAALRDVRTQVFVEEQSVPETEEWDEWDSISEHFIAISTKRDVVGVGRLQPDAKITRMAVLRDWRGHRVGALLMQSMLQRAEECGMTPWLHAQVHALEFYRRFGFVQEGEPFDEAGIAHCTMRRLKKG